MGEFPKFQDKTGKTYGRLYVLRRLPNDHRGLVIWWCRCKCGTELPVEAGNLSTGNTQSCGCLQKERTAARTRGTPFANAYHTLQNQAKQRGLKVTLTFRQFLNFTQVSDCYYCRDPLIWLPYNRQASNLDRRDSTQGYTKTNCVACCSECNRMKQKLSEVDFILRCKKVAQKHEC